MYGRENTVFPPPLIPPHPTPPRLPPASLSSESHSNRLADSELGHRVGNTLPSPAMDIFGSRFGQKKSPWCPVYFVRLGLVQVK